MQAAPLIEWPEPVMELIGFISIFLTAGAIGFRYSSLRGKLGRDGAGTSDALVYATAAQRAAVLGLVGAAAGGRRPTGRDPGRPAARGSSASRGA